MRSGILILFTILLFTPVLYDLYFAYSIAEAKFDASSGIADLSEKAKLQLLKVPVNLLDKDESDEVWYQNKLYDVAERQIIHDTIFVYLVHDADEESFLYAGSTVIGNYFGIYSCDLNAPNKKSTFFPDLKYANRFTCSESFFLPTVIRWIKLDIPASCQFNEDIPSPPPRV